MTDGGGLDLHPPPSHIRKPLGKGRPFTPQGDFVVYSSTKSPCEEDPHSVAWRIPLQIPSSPPWTLLSAEIKNDRELSSMYEGRGATLYSFDGGQRGAIRLEERCVNHSLKVLLPVRIAGMEPCLRVDTCPTMLLPLQPLKRCPSLMLCARGRQTKRTLFAWSSYGSGLDQGVPV